MSEITLLHRENRVASIFAGIGRTVAQYAASFRAGLDARDAYEHYSMMNESQLERLGLKREEIPALVMRRYIAVGK